jgi:transposase
MAKPYSQDLRERLIAAVAAASSRRETAARFSSGVSSAIK